MNFIVVTFCYVLALTLTQYWQSYGLVSSIDSISMRVQTSWSSIRLQRNLISGVEIIGRSCSVWRLRTETHFQLKELNYSRCFTKLPIDLRNISSGVRDEQLCRERWRATFQWMINGRFMLIVVDLNKKNMEREKKKNFWKLFIWNEKEKKARERSVGGKTGSCNRSFVFFIFFIIFIIFFIFISLLPSSIPFSIPFSIHSSSSSTSSYFPRC